MNTIRDHNPGVRLLPRKLGVELKPIPFIAWLNGVARVLKSSAQATWVSFDCTKTFITQLRGRYQLKNQLRIG